MEEEYAQEYSDSERRRFVIISVTLAALLVFAVQFLFFSQLEAFADRAHCYELWGIEGPALLMYGLFVGLPLFLALTVGGWFSWRGYQIVRQQRTPLAGEKVFQRKKVLRGKEAVQIGLLHHIPLVLLLLFALWGAFQPPGILSPGVIYDYSVCAE